jgi:hypothetical protein
MDSIDPSQKPRAPETARILRFPGRLQVVTSENEEGMRVLKCLVRISRSAIDPTTEELPLSEEFRALRFRSVGKLHQALRAELRR